ncbi:MAG: phosphotransferase [Deltaproteobacteria bacterium]|nr:phosphotransferase [Deltaproteobacteria bacterium]
MARQETNAAPPGDAHKQLANLVCQHYDLGQICRLERIDLGYINVSYTLVMNKDGAVKQYLLRRYRTGTSESRIKFEHALLAELEARGFSLAPSLIPTRQGSTYVKTTSLLRGLHKDYVAIFSYLPGEDRYSWHRPFCTAVELKEAARVLALYHNTITGWQGIAEWQGPRIIDKIPWLPEKWQRQAQQAANSSFDRLFLREADFLSTILTNPRYIPQRSIYDDLPHLAIHGDYHPGNLKFSGRAITGLFDFDWAEMDARCFDVGLALMYFCCSWELNSNGDLLVDKIQTFMQSYQESAQDIGQLGPLSIAELQHLPKMIFAADAHIIDWTINDYYHFRSDPDQCPLYFQHGVNLLKWLERNWTALSLLSRDL